MATKRSKGEEKAFEELKIINKKIRELMVENAKLERSLRSHFNACKFWKRVKENK